MLIHDDIQMDQRQWRKGSTKLLADIPEFIALADWRSFSSVSGDDIISGNNEGSSLVGLVNVTPMRRALLLSVVYWMNLISICKKR